MIAYAIKWTGSNLNLYISNTGRNNALLNRAKLFLSKVEAEKYHEVRLINNGKLKSNYTIVEVEINEIPAEDKI